MIFLRDKQVAAKLGASRATVWRWAKTEPDFPQPIKVTAGITAWIDTEVDAYQERRIAAARGAKVAA